MKISIYVDGSGGSNSGYGYFVKETGESFYEKKLDLTNNQAEYLAIISALNKFIDSNDKITIYSDSRNTVNQLNHEFAINNDELRRLAQEAWSIIGKLSDKPLIKWIPRKENLAGKMLGS
ncbi:MAG: RNase H family protein [Nitrosopumilus sp.]|nr:reverse transcriptase-like protein [Nitrososphaerota archaeon]